MFFIFCVELCYILWSVLLHHWSCIAPLFLDTIWVSSDQERLYFLIFFAISSFYFFVPAAFILVLDTIWVSRDQERLWRIWRWFVIWCGEFVWQWRKFKREMWRSCFRKTLCGLKRNKECWLNARRTKRMRLVGEVGWSIGERRFIFTMPVASCRGNEFIPSATSC